MDSYSIDQELVRTILEITAGVREAAIVLAGNASVAWERGLLPFRAGPGSLTAPFPIVPQIQNVQPSICDCSSPFIFKSIGRVS